MRSKVGRIGMYAAGVFVLTNSFGAQVLANGVSVPEIDGNTISIGLTVLAGAALIIRSRLTK